MAMHHVIVINSDWSVGYSNEELGAAINAVMRTCGETHHERSDAEICGITYAGNSINGFHRALENAARDFL